MRDIGKLLSRGLKEWVDDGVCPPEVLARIEASLRPARRRPWWQSWPAYAGAVAAVFLLLLVMASQSVDMSHQLASIPLVGGLATNLLYPGTDVEVDDLAGRVPGEPVASTKHDGVRLDLYQPTLGTDAIRIQYSLRGAGLNTQAAMTRFEAELAGPKGVLRLQRTRIERSGDQVLMTAEYEPVLPGQALTLTVKNLPLQTPAAQAVWQVAIKP
ncbi:MAG TPA: hypothetical protein VNT01_09025 [Symbiobacteriaceae bacterium]|nr:hypothetical protein [Symbiobacteriaceae bacterium]